MFRKNVGAEIYQTVEEDPSPVDAEIIGQIPVWVEGSLLRVGPGKFEWGDSKYNHWFDGDAILNRFEIKEGAVKFSSRFIRSNSFLESEKRGCIAFSQFGTLAPPDPCQNIFARFFSYFTLPEITDNCNVNIVKIKGDTFASTEATRMWKIDQNTLESLEEVDVQGQLSGTTFIRALVGRQKGPVWDTIPHPELQQRRTRGQHLKICTILNSKSDD